MKKLNDSDRVYIYIDDSKSILKRILSPNRRNEKPLVV